MQAEPFAIDVGGATLTGLEQGEGLPVVFLHAGVCDKRMWLDQMQAVDDAGWHAIAYDRRGYGEATSPDEAFSHLDDLEAVLDALDIHAVVLVGCSMGGGLAVDFALAHPGRVIGLVLMGTSVTGAPWTATAEERAIEIAEEDAWERGDIDLLNKVQAHEWLDGPRTQSGRVGGAARTLFLDMNAAALSKPRLTQEEDGPDAWGRIETVTAPTLLVVGDEDFTAIVERHETLSETMPNAFGVVIEGAAHIPSIEKPELVNSLLLQFLDAFDGDESDEDSEA
ncbi:alpha/beta hydrolase [Devosia sp. XJ19-1]|uniref:Alpha/beta hydrolase n=1 Tax=Devosia ureilytica TaxID=2952754 RepID=A0A9Q4ANY4_9HYPH|nr:alpha/beta hydrolase [Devosia ureilytica]MCP8883671.1 alpha/beta hydrolase [Devosia ureilytica]MCP8887279.1 alpha/beta hydrolase [Devosia ureilytica]